jgi:hypothetical protein
MGFAKPTLLVIAGAVGALATIVACGDDDSVVDARAADANCSCPSIQERIRQYSMTTAMTSDAESGVIDAACPMGGIVLGGGCWTTADTSQQIIARDSRPTALGYSCQFLNLNNGQGEIGATAICLVPEGTP